MAFLDCELGEQASWIDFRERRMRLSVLHKIHRAESASGAPSRRPWHRQTMGIAGVLEVTGTRRDRRWIEYNETITQLRQWVGDAHPVDSLKGG